MRIFVDTSAMFALLDRDDEHHREAADWFDRCGQDPDCVLITHNYVVVESAALVQGRLGSKAARMLLDGLIPAFSVFYIDEHLHRPAVSAFLTADRRRLSLVDCVSFELMRDRGIEQAFAFDTDFVSEGFTLVP